MARRIIEAGYPTTLWARRPATLEPFAGPQARLAGTRAELGSASDVLCVCVVDDAGVGDVLRGTEGALSAMAPGSVAVVHSTVHPATCVRLQQDFPAIHVVDAPVSGGGARAANGELLVMAGGAPEVVDRCRPLFETYANLVVHLGEISAGLEAKLLNNTLFAAHLAVAAEVHAIASDLGSTTKRSPLHSPTGAAAATRPSSSPGWVSVSTPSQAPPDPCSRKTSASWPTSRP
jgi:3-hydroxyisobutyrate dehydrogenase